MTIVGEGTGMMSLLYPQAFSFLSHSEPSAMCISVSEAVGLTLREVKILKVI